MGQGMKRSPSEVLLEAIDLVVGRNSDVARYLGKAIKSDDALDLLLAQAAFEELDADLKRAVARQVESSTADLTRRIAARR